MKAYFEAFFMIQLLALVIAIVFYMFPPNKNVLLRYEINGKVWKATDAFRDRRLSAHNERVREDSYDFTVKCLRVGGVAIGFGDRLWCVDRDAVIPINSKDPP